MTTGPSPRGFRIVELALGTGAVCLVERSELERGLGRCVLLHDVGADLDGMRQFVEPLQRIDLDTVLIDLPGSGLSSGDLDEDGRAAVESALLYAQAGDVAVLVVAEGRAADLLLRSQPLGVVAGYALVSPRSDIAEDEFAASEWSTVPSLCVLDPHDQVADRVAGIVAGRSRAVARRVFAHKHAALSGGRPAWPLQAGSAIATFLAEQATYWRAARSTSKKGST